MTQAPTKCACGRPVYDQCSHCGKFMCADCIMGRACRVVESGRHLPGTHPDPKYMTFERFTNALRIMSSIDRDEFEKATGYSEEELRFSGRDMDWHWSEFRENPWRWMIVTADRNSRGIFALIQERDKRP